MCHTIAIHALCTDKISHPTTHTIFLQIRDWIVPVNRRWPLASLLHTLEQLYPRVTYVSHDSHAPQAQAQMPASQPHDAACTPASQQSTPKAQKDTTQNTREVQKDTVQGIPVQCTTVQEDTTQSIPTVQNHTEGAAQNTTAVDMHADMVHDTMESARTGRGKRRHVLFEYVMLQGVNDTPELAHEVWVA